MASPDSAMPAMNPTDFRLRLFECPGGTDRDPVALGGQAPRRRAEPRPAGVNGSPWRRGIEHALARLAPPMTESSQTLATAGRPPTFAESGEAI